MQHAEPIPTSFPWRGATLVVGAIAAVELLALIGVVAVHFAPKHAVARSAAPAKTQHVRAARHTAKVAAVPTHPLRARSRVHVLVLNGNGQQGAASTEAARLQRAGYRIGGAENALRHDYARSMVLYVPGWVKEAKRLARDTGIKLVAPIDGLTPAKLKASKAVVILGNS
ncbi:MAG: LytR C-terminal domain-containing protein [Actinomycetota bacterium]|nr:LytR C-terminal domain-containing protein [Actinomycetota bacterium]